MITFVIGKQNSGKSLMAEELLMKCRGRDKYYIATMKVYDETGRERVEKHRKQREGKGFITIEQEYGICDVYEKIKDPKEAAVLLECVSNLTGNEIFENPKKDASAEETAERIAKEVRDLAARISDIIIVSSEYEQHAEGYDEETKNYIHTLDLVNDKIRKYADKTIDLGKERKIEDFKSPGGCIFNVQQDTDACI